MILYELVCRSYQNILHEELYVSKENAVKAGREFVSKINGCLLDEVTAVDVDNGVNFYVCKMRDSTVNVWEMKTADD